ncbi:hypothetical protein ACIBAG_36055 [Streptomyces sp. NPDC051243]|uniref:hypothetical protein n=1 Tax=Streptomyces sp. NPDC051243 TaxID=3365646 RepID=UPI003795D5A2
MKIITVAALTGAALLAAATPASADEGPIDFGIFQGVNETKGSVTTDSTSPWKQTDSGTNGTVPKSALEVLVDNLAWPGQK